MGGDYSRLRFDPAKDYAAVLEQQGRVALDADHNEGSAIHARRIRAEALDAMGRAAVPGGDPSNRNAFRVRATGPASFTLGPGRMYVDGLLAECRGPVPRLDRRLDEATGRGPLPWDRQPYLPAAMRQAPSGVGRTDLVYLEVWQREVTALQDPALREVALGGPDTTTRLQTVWQVRLLRDVGDGVECGDGVRGWRALTYPSPARLTAGEDPAPAGPDPCQAEEGGGYRGLENRLYRVQVHVGGPLGTARFKWSRDNASLAVGVERITPDGTRTRLTVTRLGRDAVNRFAVGDWVEVEDADTELSHASGHLARIVAADEANRTLTVSPPLPAGYAADPARRTLVRRWDTHASTAAGPDGLIPADGTTVELEDGVRVALSVTSPGAALRAGDYWVFAARTLDASVEPLQAAPPRGPQRHFARLALVTWGADAASTRVQDCRVPWPPRGGCGCCTVVVKPGESIQKALDGLPPEGGCVCLKPGVHAVTEPLRIARSDVRVHGEAPGVRIVRTNGETVLRVGAPDGVEIDRVFLERLRLESVGETEDGAGVLRITAAADVEVRWCDFAVAEAEAEAEAEAGGRRDATETEAEEVEAAGSVAERIAAEARRGEAAAEARRRLRDAAAPSLGIRASQVQRLFVERCTFGRVESGVDVDASGAVTVADCRFDGPAETTDEATVSRGARGVRLQDDVVGPNQVLRNEFQHYAEAVRVGAAATPTVVEDNRVFRSGAFGGGELWPLQKDEGGTTIPGPELRAEFAISASAPDVVVARNYVRLTDPSHRGILVTGPGSMVCGNRVEAQLEEAKVPPLGIVLAGDEAGVPSRTTVADNHCTGGMFSIVALGTEFVRLEGVRITGNHVAGELDALRAEPLMAPGEVPSRASVLQLRQAHRRAGEGIHAFFVRASDVADNEVAGSAAAMVVRTCSELSVRQNRVAWCVTGIWMAASTLLSVRGNSVDRVYEAGIWGELLHESVLADNVLVDCRGAAVYVWGGNDDRVEGNRIREGGFGIACFRMTGLTVSGNGVKRTGRTGILAHACTAVACGHNRLEGCATRVGAVGVVFGAPQSESGSAPATAPLCAGIAVIECGRTVEVEACDVRETGGAVRLEPNPPRFELLIDAFAGIDAYVRVHGCTLRGAQVHPFNPQSRVLRLDDQGDEHELMPISGVEFQAELIRTGEVLDCVLEGQGEPIVECRMRGDLLFHHNRCRNHRLVMAARDNAPHPAVRLWAVNQMIVGNRILDMAFPNQALEIRGAMLTGSGNIVTGGAALTVTQPPKPAWNDANLASSP